MICYCALYYTVVKGSILKMIKEIVTRSEIVLYWDICMRKTEDTKYYTYLNGELIKISNKTHITLRNISGKNAEVEIYTDSAKKELFYKKSFTMPERREIIDVTAAPYNAVGDGKTMNTAAIQKAIDDCRENGVVYFPEGVYLTGALDLHSDMELYVCEGATILGSDDPNDYLPKIWSRFEGVEMECFRSLINIGNIDDRDKIVCENILVCGGGKIYGGGKTLKENVIAVEKERLKDYFASLSKESLFSVNETIIAGRSRPKLINVSCARNVVMDNITFGNGSSWNIHILYSDNVVTCNSSIYSLGVSNGDGWDPDSSTNCAIFNCDFCTGDDCVAIKSGKNPEGNVIARPCSNIWVFDCRSEDGHGISIGSEISGGISDVYIWDCNITKSQIGCNIKATKKRGGYIKNVFVKNSSFASLNIGLVPYNDDGVAAPTAPVFSGIYFENVRLYGEVLEYREKYTKKTNAITIAGFDDDHRISDVKFNNVTIGNGHSSQRQIFGLERVENLSILNMTVK